MPAGPRVISWSPMCWRSADSAWDTAGSLTPRALAAAVTEPSLATRTKAFSWVRVMTLTTYAPSGVGEPPKLGSAVHVWGGYAGSGACRVRAGGQRGACAGAAGPVRPRGTGPGRRPQ